MTPEPEKRREKELHVKIATEIVGEGLGLKANATISPSDPPPLSGPVTGRPRSEGHVFPLVPAK